MLSDYNTGNKMCLLRKSIYGLKQSGRTWYQKLDGIQRKFGANPTMGDSCLFQPGTGEDILLIVIYVDDILLAAKNEQRISDFQKMLSFEFEIKDLGDAKYCLGVEFTRTKYEVKMCQQGYVYELLERFDMTNCNPVSTPMDLGTKLQKNVKVTD